MPGATLFGASKHNLVHYGVWWRGVWRIGGFISHMVCVWWCTRRPELRESKIRRASDHFLSPQTRKQIQKGGIKSIHERLENEGGIVPTSVALAAQGRKSKLKKENLKAALKYETTLNRVSGCCCTSVGWRLSGWTRGHCS